MKFLHDKLGNPSVSLNIRLFLAKLVINTEEVSNLLFLQIFFVVICISLKKPTAKKDTKNRARHFSSLNELANYICLFNIILLPFSFKTCKLVSIDLAVLF